MSESDFESTPTPPPGGPSGETTPPPPGGPTPPPPGTSSPPSTFPSSYPANAASVPVYSQPSAGSRTSTNAVIALVLAVVSWAVCPLIPAIVALVLASMAKREIDQSGGRVSGGGLVTAAKIVSWINIGVCAAGIVVGLLIVLIAAIAG